MKLSWKLFFITTPMFVLFLTLFGTWMIQDSFQNSLNKEIDRCMVENQMFQNSYELTQNSLSQDQKQHVSTKKLVESFHHKSASDDGSVRIFSANGFLLYQDSEFQIEHQITEILNERQNVGYQIFQLENEVYLVVVCRTSLGEYIETTKNISDVFQDRSSMYLRYQISVLLMTSLVGCLTFLILFLVMRNMHRLSFATRQFARGQYDMRVTIRSDDEIGMLADDFNWMANAMNVQMEKLKNEVQRQEEFTAAFAHELKTPLTSIIGYADTIRQMELTPEETDMCANYIYHQGKRLQSLSYKLLEMTMAGKQDLSYNEISVSDFLDEIQKTAMPSLLEKHLSLTIKADSGILRGDRELLASVFLNLIDNSRKASKPGQEIRLTGTQLSDCYAISVEDEGGGIPPEDLDRITEAFYMVDKSRSRKEGGAGLGLTLCQKIIDLHHAVWYFENNPEKGLKVTVRFDQQDQTLRGRKKQRPESEDHMGIACPEET
ncbi:MAG: HAMP domain-containing histidine kinase [Robinsoniella sp.]|nr:HAMP domain-containing histidine kinase [Robinsoniella sp.]